MNNKAKLQCGCCCWLAGSIAGCKHYLWFVYMQEATCFQEKLLQVSWLVLSWSLGMKLLLLLLDGFKQTRMNGKGKNKYSAKNFKKQKVSRIELSRINAELHIDKLIQ